MAFLACLIPLKGISSEPMVLVFNSFLSDGTTITLPLEGKVNVVIDWGDGTRAAVKNPGLVSHTYASNGIYTVRITGQLEQFGLGSVTYPNAEKLSQVTSFGDLGLISLSGAFNSSNNLTAIPESLPGSVRNLSFLFANNRRFNLPLNHWDVSHVRSMARMFYNAKSFNQPLHDWDVGQVENMAGMFNGATVFNQPIGNWNVSNVKNMSSMFWFANAFDQPLSTWNVSHVKSMENMFNERFSGSKYDELLISWAKLPLQPYVIFNAGNNQYSSGEAEKARRSLMKNHHWSVFDRSGISVRVIHNNLNNLGKVAGQGNYQTGDTVTLTAIPGSGNRLDHWEAYGNVDIHDTIIHFILDSIRPSIKAHWVRLDQDVMVLEVNTWLGPGTSVTLPLFGEVDLLVDWGDGQITEVKKPGLITHQYFDEGRYSIVLKGTLEQFGNGPVGYDNTEKLIGVGQYGNLGLKSLSGAFHHAKNLRNIPWNFPATVTDLSYMFYHGPAWISGSYQDSDVRHVINMQSMFEGLSPSISFEYWDVSSVTDMTDMFKDGYINPILYNRMLIAWAELPLQDSVHLHAGQSQYSLGAATEARQRIIDHFHWTITDGGDDGFPLPPPIDLSTLNYDSILWPVRYDDPFSDNYFIIGYYRKYDYQMDYGLRLFLLDKHNEFLYATGGAMDSRSLRMDLFRETEEGFMPVWQIDPLIHTLVDDSPLIVMTAGGDEMGDGGSTVYFLENNQLQEIGYMHITQYDIKLPYEPQYNAIGPFTSITRHQNKYYFHFDTEQIAINPWGRQQRILDASSCYYLFDGQTLELIIKDENN